MDSQPAPHPNEPLRAELANRPPGAPVRVIIEQPRGSWIGKALRWVVGIVLVLLVIGAFNNYSEEPAGGIQERWHSLSRSARDKVAIISVEGTILGDESFVKHQIDKVREDDNVKAIVLRVDSPGGTVTGSDYIYHHLKELIDEKQIPMVVSMGSIAASGGYYVAMAAGDQENLVFAEPTTWTGSIGVIIPHYDLSGLLEKLNVSDDSIASNPLKMMGSPTRKFPEPIRAEEQAILKGLVDSSFEGFKEIVLASRKALRENKAAQDVVFTGRIFTAKQAQENLLIDKLGFVEDAVDRAIELAGLDRDETRVIKYHQYRGVMEDLLFGPQGRARGLDLSALVELATPKAYFLFTGLPGMVASPR